jgi:hypothetical protein
MTDLGGRAGRWSVTQVVAAAESALDGALGEDNWVQGYEGAYLWLNQATLRKRSVPAERAETLAAAAIARIPGIYAAYTRSDAMAGRLPQTRIGRIVSRSFHPVVSGDVAVVSESGFLGRRLPVGSSHGEPYAYDTHVPLLIAGPGIRAGVYTERVSTLDLAATLAFALHVEQPSGCEGRILAAPVGGRAAAPFDHESKRLGGHPR